MGSHTSSTDDYLDATLLSRSGELLYLTRRAVSGEREHLKGNAEGIETSGSFLHDGQIGGTAHNDADQWRCLHLYPAMRAL